MAENPGRWMSAELDNAGLKNCPRCGGTAFCYKTTTQMIAVECERCGLEVEAVTEEAARQKWSELNG